MKPAAQPMPPLETPVLALYRGEWHILERHTETPGWEETFKEFSYWCDGQDDGTEYDDEDVTRWLHLPPKDISDPALGGGA